MLGYGRDESAPTPGGLFVAHFTVCFVDISVCSPRIRNPFRIHSRNVRNVFVICVLHIRHAKVWFLRCKSMVFGVQKGGFYIAKVWFLFFECWVVAICLECYRNPSAALSQSVSSRRVRFIAPAYTCSPPILCVFG